MPIPLRTDFDAAQLRAIAKRTRDAPQARRLLALAAVYEGASRTEAARIAVSTGTEVCAIVGFQNSLVGGFSGVR
jgi:hypothetical protein